MYYIVPLFPHGAGRPSAGQTTNMYTIFTFLAALLLYVRISNALPMTYRQETMNDADTGFWNAFRHLTKPSWNEATQNLSPGCSLINAEDIQNLPGWDALKATAEQRWGSGQYTVETRNFSDLEKVAQLCLPSGPIHVFLNGTPSCTSRDATVKFGPLGSRSSVSLAMPVGTSFSSHLSITKPSLIGANATILSAKLGIPDLTGLTEHTYGLMSLSNREESTALVHGGDIRDEMAFVAGEQGQLCSLTSSSTSCTGRGYSEIELHAKGWVWFNYGSKSHALNIEEIIDQVERTSSIAFTVEISSERRGRWSNSCS